ncbi:MAG: YjgP/YjgQ family permease [Calditrichaeota bacterium]|nr:MAG: YjgP/YjgQ family permease [Calditrichota bacterium]
MKILSRYILKEHFAPFFFAFFTITFLLVIDYVPKITDSVMDKDISLWVALELLGLNLAWMLALSVPMSALVATLMAFGRLTSDFEIIAIKASGINMIRILIPVLLAGGVLTYGMIEFNDKILPDLNKKARELRGDISAMRPTLVFRSGIFISDIPGYLVLLDEINHKTSEVKNVRITDTKQPEAPKIIIAENGFLKMTDGNKNMQFTLFNGEIHSLDAEDINNYRKVEFKEQVINITGTGSELERKESQHRYDREMSISDMQDRVVTSAEQLKPNRNNISTRLEEHADYLFADSFVYKSEVSDPDSAALIYVKNSVNNLSNTYDRSMKNIKRAKGNMAKFKIEIYKKYSIPFAIIAFILIGAPLGILTKKKGMGVAITISITLFVFYWASLIVGEDIADRQIMSPFWAMWIANFIIGAIGLYLLYLVVTEKPIFSWFRRKK